MAGGQADDAFRCKIGTPPRCSHVSSGPRPTFTQPNSIVVAANGDIFIAEGHGGQTPGASPDTVSRISKFSRDGSFIKSFGKLGAAAGEFRLPHDITLDAQGRLFVADRGNFRIQNPASPCHPATLDTVKAAHGYRQQHGLSYHIEVDGGITQATACAATKAGANVLVAGSALFGASDMQSAISAMRSS